MFDGNYRTRREVNLSGRRGRHGAPESNKSAILAASKLKRSERLQKQKQERAAVRVQKVYRGYRARRQLAKELEQALVQQQQQSNSCSALTLQQRTTVWNVRLGLPAGLDDASTLQQQQQKWRRDYAEAIRSTQPLLQPCTALATHRILIHCFSSLSAIFSDESASAAGSLRDVSTILDYCLKTNEHSVVAQPQSDYFWRKLGGRRGYLELVDCLWKSLLLLTTDEAITTTSSSSSNNVRLAVVEQLWTYLKKSTPNTLHGRAVLGALVLCSRRAGQQKHGLLLDLSFQTVHDEYLVPLVQVLCNSGMTDAADNNGPLLCAVRHMVESGQDVLLSNAILLLQQDHDRRSSSSSSPTALIQLLGLILPRRNSPLTVLTGTVVRDGPEQVMKKMINNSTAKDDDGSTDVDMAADNDVMMEESDDDDEEEESRVHAPPLSRAAAASKKAKTAITSRLTRQELLTLPKLDALYQEEMSKWRKQVFVEIDGLKRNKKESLVELAVQLGNPDQWLAWGKTLLSNPAETEEVRSAQEAYVTLLAVLLQSCTGLRPRQSASSPFLTKLAFDRALLEKIWRFVLLQETNRSPNSVVVYTAWTVFCDLFAHHLIALRDDQFLANHTTQQGTSRVILAEHVIGHLRDLLYELYWSKPVRAADLRRDGVATMEEDERALLAARGRLLLVGTKLWNSLYERWCRLVRHTPFCDESTWLFPAMTTLSGENAVVGMHSNQASRPYEDMDVDYSDSDEDEEIDHPMSPADAENEALADAFSDPKMARILTSIPQALPFDRRVKLFDSLLTADKLKTQDESAEMREAMLRMMRGEEHEHPGRERVEIRRVHLYDDSMQQLNQLGPKLKRKVQVSFINQHGAQEAGIDGGGVFKEFIDDLIKDAFSIENTTASYRLFTVTPLQTLAVNPALTQDLSLLPHYEFLGRVLGKAVYESILVEPQFCLPFLNQLLGKHNSLEDLKNFDGEYYKNLTALVSLSAAEIDSMGLTFELTLVGGADGASTRTVELMANGRHTAVTKQNVIQYIHLVSHRRLNVEGAQQTKAFLRGFRDLIPAAWVRLFSAYELQKLISGDDSIKGIDVSSLKSAMQYAAGYHPSQPVIQWFWEVVDEMSPSQQGKFLKFMTSCSRQPLLGFGSLEPAPCVQQIRLPEALFLEGDAVIRKNAPLPTSSTCMNLLKLPNYRSKILLRDKLLAAIEAGAGFELT